jgi:hypothetical protein
MKKRNWLVSLGLAASLLPSAPAIAADHRDGAATLTDPSTDINDVYGWMDSGGTSVYLAMTVYPAAPSTGAKFSNAAYYVFHTTARATALTPTPAASVDIVCGFDNAATQNISCWFGDSTKFLYGNASNAASPLNNSDSSISVFAGTRKDHFFFNLDGFNQVRKNVKATAAAGQFTFDGNGCPTKINGATTGLTAQQTQLGQAPGGGTAQDFFKTLDTLAIVVKVPLTLLNKGTANVPILSVSAATYRKG